MTAPEQSILEIMQAAGQEPPRVQLPPALAEGGTDDDGAATGRAGRYEVIGPLAEGGVGEVLRGRDLDLGRDVALKVLREKHRTNPELVQRLLDEAQIGGQLQHPGIVPVYEIGVDEAHRPFLAMKLVKGKTLAARLAERATPAEGRRRVLRLFEQLAEAVAYAHARGVVHRDLKPSNVMVGAFGEVQVLDWGFAKVLRRGGLADEHRGDTREADVTRIATVRSSEGSSVAGSVMGTPAYMPPEQALGEIDRLDERCDVFALGAVLCEILTGKPPYVGKAEDLLTLAAGARLDDAYERLDACGADTSLVALCRDCLQPLRSDRPRDASVVAESVHEYLASVEERARQARIASAEARAASEKAEAEADRQHRGRRQSLLVGVSLLALLVAAIGGAWGLKADARAQATRTASAVMAALQDAERLRGEKRLEEAETAAKRAAVLSAEGGADPELRDSADGLLASIQTERTELEAQRAQQAKDETMASRIEEIEWGALVLDTRSPEYRRGEQPLREAFLAYGLDLESLEPEAIASAVAQSTISDELLRGIEQWLFVRWSNAREQSAEWAHLAAVVEAIEPDPWSSSVRRAALANDPDALRKAARDNASLASRPERAVMLARWLVGAGETEVALRLLEAHLVAQPKDVMAHEWARMLAQHLGRAEVTRRHAVACVALRPSSPRALRALSDACFVLDDQRLALAFAERCLAAAPESTYHVDRVVQLHQAQGTLAEALDAWQRELDGSPDAPQTLTLVGAALAAQGALDDAQEVLERLIELRPGSAQALGWSAWVHVRAGRLEEAAQAYAQAARLEPGNSQWARQLGAIVAGPAGDTPHPAAVRRLEDLLPNASPAIRYDFLLGYAEQIAGFRDDDGVAALDEAASLSPRSAEPHLQAATLRARYAPDPQAAHEAARRAVERNPWSDRGLMLLGMTAWQLGRVDEALERIREAVRRQDASGEAAQVWMWILAFHGLGDEAIDYYRARVAEHPTRGDRRYLGHALLRAGRREEAAEVLGGLWREASTWGGVAAGYAVALWRSGRPDEAQRVLEEFVQAHPRLGQRSVVPILSDLYLRRGLPERARDLELEALRLQPGNGYLERDVAYAAAWCDEPRAARQWCETRFPTPRSPNASVHIACGIAEALLARGELTEAIARFERALRGSPQYLMLQEYLAIARLARGDRREAEAAVHALRVRGGVPASSVEALLAWEAGRFDEAVEQLESRRKTLINQAFRGFALPDEVVENQQRDSRLDRLATWGRRLAGLRDHADAIVSGAYDAPSARDALDAAEVARCADAHAVAGRYYRQAFESYLREFRWEGLRVRFRAARAAVLASATEAVDAETRKSLHESARTWLQDELEEWRLRLSERISPGRRYPSALDPELWNWKFHVDLASVRDADALAELPDAEREAWEEFWREVDEVLASPKR